MHISMFDETAPIITISIACSNQKELLYVGEKIAFDSG